MNYSETVAALISIAATTTTDNNFAAILPRAFDYAEQRIYRELDLLSTVVSDATQSFVADNRALALPIEATWVTVQQVNAITPKTATPETGLRNPLIPVTREWLNAVYGAATGAALPRYFAMQNEQTIIVGPWPDDTYPVEFVGTIRPAPLSPSNTSTFLTANLPDLFIAACMIFIAGYQRDFGAQSDDPQMAQSWEAQYKMLFSSANAEEQRKKFGASGWTSMSAPTASTPNRG